MDVNDILKLMDKVDSTKIHEIKIQDEKFQLTISKSSIENTTAPAKTVSPIIENNTVSTEDIQTISTPSTSEDDCGGNIIHAPLVGIYYESSSPSAQPFVKVGDKVNEGDVVCVIEAMKVFNEIKSPYSGIVKKILVTNQEIVEYDQPLVIIGDQT